MILAQGLLRAGRGAAGMVRAIAGDYSRKGVAMIAAALAFYLFLALFPFLLVIIAATGYLLGSSHQALELLRGLLEQGLPGSGLHIEEQLRSIVAHRAIVGGLGLLGLVWSASGAFAMLSRALRIIWEVRRESRFLLSGRLRAVMLTLLAVIFLIISAALTAVMSILRHASSAGVPLIGGEMLWRLVAVGLPLGISFTTFLALYRIVPAPQLALRHLAVGAGFAAAGWEIAKRGFSYYLEHFARFNLVYGPVATIVVLMVWIYISVIIALVGAELAWVHAQRQPG